MFDHVSLTVSDLGRAKRFYAAALAPLGIEVRMEVTAEQSGTGAFFGMGVGPRATFWLGEGERPTGRAHIAFAATTRAAVDAFHRAALEAGGRDNGAPGLRPYYSPTYYGAFVLDPDGHNIEAVCHASG